MENVHIQKERKVITYSDFWRTSEVMLEKGECEEEGRYFQFMGSLIFSSFSFEAFLNHIGENIFNCWNDIERKMGPKEKLSLIAEKLNINVNYGNMPWQIIPEIIGFRNKIAHGKNEMLRLEKVVPKNENYEKIMHDFMFADWQEFATLENARKVREQLDKIFNIVHKAANIEDDYLFHHGLQTGSAKIVQ